MSSNGHQQLRSIEVLNSHRDPRSDVTLKLPARPENVAVVRHVLGAFAHALGLSVELVEDLRLAITEACTNVVRHAYADEDPGTVEISIQPQEELVYVTVADRGRGIGTSADASGPGLGLPLIAAVADTVDLQPMSGGGSRVVMTFARRRLGEPA
jgi:anti-sigma regulatory factor (Ser/Thr protein kinase)